MPAIIYAHTCCVVARQYSAVLRMLQIRQSSSTLNFAASQPSFSFSRLVMVRPPLLLLDLDMLKKNSKKRKSIKQRNQDLESIIHLLKFVIFLTVTQSMYSLRSCLVGKKSPSTNYEVVEKVKTKHVTQNVYT